MTIIDWVQHAALMGLCVALAWHIIINKRQIAELKSSVEKTIGAPLIKKQNKISMQLIRAAKVLGLPMPNLDENEDSYRQRLLKIQRGER